MHANIVAAAVEYQSPAFQATLAALMLPEGSVVLALAVQLAHVAERCMRGDSVEDTKTPLFVPGPLEVRTNILLIARARL